MEDFDFYFCLAINNFTYAIIVTNITILRILQQVIFLIKPNISKESWHHCRIVKFSEVETKKKFSCMVVHLASSYVQKNLQCNIYEKNKNI